MSKETVLAANEGRTEQHIRDSSSTEKLRAFNCCEKMDLPSKNATPDTDTPLTPGKRLVFRNSG